MLRSLPAFRLFLLKYTSVPTLCSQASGVQTETNDTVDMTRRERAMRTLIERYVLLDMQAGNEALGGNGPRKNANTANASPVREDLFTVDETWRESHHADLPGSRQA